MHDGSMDTLEQVLDHYAHDGRNIETGEYADDGADIRIKADLLVGFILSSLERKDVINFLKNLTDWEFISDLRFSIPLVTF